LVAGFRPYSFDSIRRGTGKREFAYKPTPTTSLNGSSSSVEFLLEVLKASKVPVDGILKWAWIESAAMAFPLRSGGCHVLPKQGVIDVSLTTDQAMLLMTVLSMTATKEHSPPPLNFNAA
jgi:hypothetical protein